MVSSVLEQYSIADFLEWHRKKTLRLNPDFQRRSVWSESAKTMLIDTILRRWPMPKVYMRTKIDLATQTSFREVVDGQQRLRAIIDFAEGKFALGKRAREFEGARYSTLDPELQQNFLTYTIGSEQLINASDTDVLEVFSRLNSYTVPLNAAELRHAQFQGDFKWAVHDATVRWHVLWDDLNLVTRRQRLRMADDSLMSEMFGIALEGVRDGGEANIKKLYQRHDDTFPERAAVESAIDRTLTVMTENFGEVLEAGRPLARAPHFLMFFAATCHGVVGIQRGDIAPDVFPPRPEPLAQLGVALHNLELLNEIIELDENVPQDWQAFWRASQSSTQRIASRSVRFPVFCRALTAERLA